MAVEPGKTERHEATQHLRRLARRIVAEALERVPLRAALLAGSAGRGDAGIIVAGAVSLVAHFAVGAAKSLFTLRSWWAAGLEMTLAGVIVGGATYAVGLSFS